ncbi:multidrug effflux MFS transporter [Arthrobacter glacialis]|uniref:Bcr/CflA family drug resistance efflux transporter n=1 Tax=Arthrobacter glacialis TaxID=1664 RepID=A0A2S3ZR43_ARTGL|nr:multidrug effflux MFS transporter [Arthrobacter glacialis]POH60536.1 Bcr/CflA family drug resistance efflux transporter [Arthrobacter glacialis]POH71705.1 Bcr/CflA family drug resistance efflux transporter [Arthrobacter glacialis]
MTITAHPGDALSRRQKLVYVLVLGLLTALGPFTIDLYLPAFPIIGHELGVSAAAVQLTLTATTIGFAAGQLVVGPFSDKFGRRMPLILATALHVGASIGAAMSTDITMLGVFRVLQGIGAAGGGVVAMAMIRDLFGGYQLVRMLSRMSLVNGMAPILAPVIGSQLLRVMDWPGIFWFLAGYGTLVVIAAFVFIIETLPPEKRHSDGVSVASRYKAVFSDRIFVGTLFVGGLNFAALFTYLSASTFLFQNTYGFTPQQYGYLFAVNSLGVVAGVQIASRIMRHTGPQWVIAGATLAQVASAAAIVICDQLGLGLWGIMVPLWFFICATGFMFPSVQVMGLARNGRQAGTAASLLGAATFGFAGMITPVVGLVGVAATSMATIMGICSLLAMAALWLIVRPRMVPKI